MRISRILFVLPMFGLLLGCPDPVKRQQDHVLNRIGFGPDAWSRQRIAQLGVSAYIEEQLNPSTLDDSALEAEIASLYPVTQMTYAVSRGTFNEYTGNPDTGPFVPIRDQTRAKILRCVKSKKQLEQVLTDFWYNHFNVDSGVDEGRWGFLTMERDAIRPNVFGKFETMLRAVAQNPGMLDYLDNSLNFKDGFLYLGLTRGINENYAREVMELHTVGVDYGYTQDDVHMLARAFTGWTIPVTPSEFPSGFQYLSQGHDKTAKSLFNGALQLAANRGLQDGIDALHFLATQPATAQRVATQLCQRFISEDAPPPNVIANAKQVFLDTGGDLREVTRTILTSAEFLSLNAENNKVKRPIQFLASLARMAGVSDDATFASEMDGYLQLMGEGLYRAGPPTGYPESSRFWAGEGPYIVRVKLAWMATHGQSGFDGSQLTVTDTTPNAVVDQLSAVILRNGIKPATRQQLIALATSLPDTARAQEVAATLFATPEFLVH